MWKKIACGMLVMVCWATPTFGYLADVPYDFRQENWATSEGAGSCGYASTVACLRWAGQAAIAEWVRANRGGGVWEDVLIELAEDVGLDYNYTTEADMDFLEWVDRNRLTAAIWFYPAHCVTFVGIDRDRDVVLLLDNNEINHYREVPLAEFQKYWKEFGGFALAYIISPPPPWPVMP